MTMKHHSCQNVATSLSAIPSTRFADLSNLPKPRWRDALVALALPALRVHNYRNLHKSMFYEAVCDVDCPERK